MAFNMLRLSISKRKHYSGFRPWICIYSTKNGVVRGNSIKHTLEWVYRQTAGCDKKQTKSPVGGEHLHDLMEVLLGVTASVVRDVSWTLILGLSWVSYRCTNICRYIYTSTHVSVTASCRYHHTLLSCCTCTGEEHPRRYNLRGAKRWAVLYKPNYSLEV